MIIEIHDAESRFLYGTTKIPLFDLLRQGKSQIHKAKECDFCAPDDSNEIKGQLQLVISNVGKRVHEKLELMEGFKTGN